MSLSIIVPYRDRGEHLAMFIPHMREKLRGLGARVLVVEQAGSDPFNRGKLCNVGFLESSDSSHVVFHDIDMLPVDVDYSEDEGAVHIATAASQFDGKMPYQDYFGGVTMFERSAFKKINGFSNNYWGWGLEDDDLRERCRTLGVSIARRPDQVFHSLKHPVHEGGPGHDNVEYFNKNAGVPSSILQDGLTSCRYSVVKESPGKFFSLITVDIGS